MGSEVQSPTVMRTVSFVEHIGVEFKGNVIPQTMLLADVDNDMANELVVGNIYGEVAIFKGNSSGWPWKKISLSGMLTCLSVGELLMPKKNNLVCMTAEGWCYVYDITSLASSQNMISNDESTEKPILTQELPANARVMCLADIDMDGHVEMVIGYADRVVRAFRWHETHDSLSGHFVLIQKWQLAGQIGNITINFTAQGHPELMVSQPGATFVTLRVKPSFRHVRSEGQINVRLQGLKHGIPSLERRGSFATGSRHNSSSKLNLSAHSIDLAGIRDSPGPVNQSDTVSTNSDVSYRSLENISLKGVDGSSRTFRPKLQKSVSDADQQGSRKGSTQMDGSSEEDLENLDPKFPILTGSVEKIDQGVRYGKNGIEGTTVSGTRKSRGRHSTELDISFDNEDVGILYHPVANHLARNEDSSTFMIGAVRKTNPLTLESGATEATCYAVATLDGSLVLLDNDDIVWSMQVDHEFFALSKLDVTGDGKDELVCCSWNGQTYVINHKKEIVCFHFPDNVAAFCAGYYSVHERKNVPCFVYATTTNHVYIYYNITLPHLESTHLIKTMSAKAETTELLSKLGIKADDIASLRQLYQWCLYGQDDKS